MADQPFTPAMVLAVRPDWNWKSGDFCKDFNFPHRESIPLDAFTGIGEKL
jgi:hypothetical protein